MSKLVEPPTDSTLAEWVADKEDRFTRTELENKETEMLMNEADRLEDDTDKRTKRTFDDVNKKLVQRKDEIKYWDRELENVGDKIFKENDMLRTDTSRIDKARSSAKEYLHLTENCRADRLERSGIENCADDVHFSLTHEIGVYRNILQMLDKIETEALEQIRRNQKAKHRIDKDSLNKKTTETIESHCLELKPTSADTKNLAQRAPVKPMLTNEEWTSAVDENIKYAECERTNSENMRAIIDGILQQISNDMERVVTETNTALKKRLNELKITKRRDEKQLKRVIKEIKDAETSMEDLHKCLSAKSGYLDLALHRLGQRNQRPDSENVMDEPHLRLNKEVCEIKNDMESLNKGIMDHTIKLKSLRRQQLSLEEDIDNKAHSIFIDEVICLGIRENLVIMSY